MILITGGTGLVGSHLLYFLLMENAHVRAIHRKNSNIQAVKKVFELYTAEADSLFDKIEWVEANITDIPALTEAFMGITKVYGKGIGHPCDIESNSFVKRIVVFLNEF